MLFKDFSIFSSGGLFGRAEPFVEFWYRALWGTFV